MIQNNNYDKMPSRYGVDTIKGYVRRVKTQLGYYGVEPPEFKKDPDREIVRRFEKRYGVEIIGIVKNHKNLNVSVYSFKSGSHTTDSVLLENFYKSMTVQKLGKSIADLVIQRSVLPKYCGVITHEVVVHARRAMQDLEKRMV